MTSSPEPDPTVISDAKLSTDGNSDHDDSNFVLVTQHGDESAPFDPSRTSAFAGGDQHDTDMDLSADGASTFDPSMTASMSDGPPAVNYGMAEKLAAAQKAAPPGYEILGILGRGGMGVVYEALQRSLKRRVALKMVTAGAHANPEHLVRFQVEAEAVAALQHINIVQIHEVGEHNGVPFFSLEIVDGGSLSDQVNERPMSPQRAAELVKKLAGAMHYAHQHGVIHRDIKPGNVLMTVEGEPKITDFGLAKRTDGEASTQTEAGSILGTPSYMAPEQAKGDVTQVTALADVYALGSLLYHLLTGRPPFLGSTLLETLELVRTQEPAPVRQLQPKAPRDLETICLKCLQKEPLKRYADADALARDLQHFLTGEPIEARPVGRLERFWRWCRRHPGIAALSGTVFALLVTVAVTSTTLLIQIANEKKQTELERQAAINARDLARHNEGLAKEAQQLAEKAEQIAKQNAIVAGEQGRLAVNTLYQVVTKVQQQLRLQPGNQKLRIDLLNDAFAGLTKVVAGSENSELVGRTKAAAHQLMGDISKELGRTEAALKDYQAAQKIVDALAAAEPDNEVAIWNQAVVYDKLGEINHEILGDGAVARDYYRKCIQLRQELAGRSLKSPELRPALVKQRLAVSFAKQASVALMLGDPYAAWADYQCFLELQPGGRKYQSPKEAWQSTTDPKFKDLYSAGVSRQLGEFSFHLNDLATCRAWYGRAVEQGSERLKKSPTSDDAKKVLGFGHAALGDLELQTGNATAARDHYRLGHQLFEELRAANSESADAQRNLSLSFYRLGTAHLRLGESSAADEFYQSSLRLRQGLIELEPANAFNQIDLALASARCGRPEQASVLVEKLRTRAPRDPAILFFTASTHALCAATAANSPTKDLAAQQRHVDSALNALTQAVEFGYRDVVALEHDPDLEAVRQEKRFRDLVEKLKQLQPVQ